MYKINLMKADYIEYALLFWNCESRMSVLDQQEIPVEYMEDFDRVNEIHKMIAEKVRNWDWDDYIDNPKCLPTSDEYKYEWLDGNNVITKIHKDKIYIKNTKTKEKRYIEIRLYAKFEGTGEIEIAYSRHKITNAQEGYHTEFVEWI